MLVHRAEHEFRYMQPGGNEVLAASQGKRSDAGRRSMATVYCLVDAEMMYRVSKKAKGISGLPRLPLQRLIETAPPDRFKTTFFFLPCLLPPRCCIISKSFQAVSTA